jgi:hypothetical protein
MKSAAALASGSQVQGQDRRRTSWSLDMPAAKQAAVNASRLIRLDLMAVSGGVWLPWTWVRALECSPVTAVRRAEGDVHLPAASVRSSAAAAGSLSWSPASDAHGPCPLFGAPPHSMLPTSSAGPIRQSESPATAGGSVLLKDHPCTSSGRNPVTAELTCCKRAAISKQQVSISAVHPLQMATRCKWATKRTQNISVLSAHVQQQKCLHPGSIQQATAGC